MRRTLIVSALIAAPLALAAPAGAASPPNTGCAVGWNLFDATGNDSLLALGDNVNGDHFVCLKVLAKGTVVADNTSPLRD